MRHVNCWRCGGTGKLDDPERTVCVACDGTGEDQPIVDTITPLLAKAKALAQENERLADEMTKSLDDLLKS